uniref:Ovule protein n=1 Tax=Caenorhabditis tropicalis TaxID=1561998 RepID=A0A1I7TNB3_9PELO
MAPILLFKFLQQNDRKFEFVFLSSATFTTKELCKSALTPFRHHFWGLSRTFTLQKATNKFATKNCKIVSHSYLSYPSPHNCRSEWLFGLYPSFSFTFL